MTQSRGINAPRRQWSGQELATLRELYPHQRTAEIAALLGIDLPLVYRRASLMRLRKSAAFAASDKSGCIFRGGKLGQASQFAPGQKPWNTGLKGWAAPGTEATRFKPGSTPPNRQQVGALRINTDGQLDIKLYDGLRSWVQLHHYAWFLEHGQWPPTGMVLRFKDGDEHNPAISNLQLITRRENMRLNSVHTIYPPEVARLVLLRGALKAQINRRQKTLTRQQESQ